MIAGRLRAAAKWIAKHAEQSQGVHCGLKRSASALRICATHAHTRLPGRLLV